QTGASTAAKRVPACRSHAPSADEPDFYEMRKDCVGEEERPHNGPVKGWQWSERQGPPKTSIRENNADCRDDERRSKKSCASPALQEWDLCSANEVND